MGSMFTGDAYSEMCGARVCRCNRTMPATSPRGAPIGNASGTQSVHSPTFMRRCGAADSDEGGLGAGVDLNLHGQGQGPPGSGQGVRRTVDLGARDAVLA